MFVDTAPLMEKPLAEAAGLGWQGKHTVLVSREFGSWLFLGAILTSAELPADTPHEESCGTCTRCLDICPTNAFPAPFQLDSRRCLAYLTVEHKSQFHWSFGCRWAIASMAATIAWRSARGTSSPRSAARRGCGPGRSWSGRALADLVQLDDAGFRALFAGSPIKRIGLARFLRNVLIAIGNSGDASADPAGRGAARCR